MKNHDLFVPGRLLATKGDVCTQKLVQTFPMSSPVQSSVQCGASLLVAAKCCVKHLKCEQPVLSSENCYRFPHTNRAELTRLFANFCHFWTKGLHTTVQMKTMGSAGVVAQFEFELEKPNEIFPTGPAGFRRGQPQGESRRPPRHQPGSPHAPGLRATLVQREAVAVAPVVGGRKRSSAQECVLQPTRPPWLVHAVLQQQQHYLCRLLHLFRLLLDQQRPS